MREREDKEKRENDQGCIPWSFLAGRVKEKGGGSKREGGERYRKGREKERREIPRYSSDLCCCFYFSTSSDP